MANQNIADIVSQLSGYLQAVRDLNDDHSGNRYWFWADMLDINDQDIKPLINSYLKTDDIELQTINLKEELLIIQAHVSANYLQGTSNPNNENESYIRHLHGWRIQEYISMIANYETEDGRWLTVTKNDKETRTTLFVSIKQKLIIMDFRKIES